MESFRIEYVVLVVVKSSRRVSVSELKNMPGCVLTVFPTAIKIRKID